MWKLSSENKKCNLKSEAALNSVRRTKKSDCDLNPSERGSKHGSKKYNCQRISFLSQHICSSYFLLDIFLVFLYLLEISNLASFFYPGSLTIYQGYCYCQLLNWKINSDETFAGGKGFMGNTFPKKFLETNERWLILDWPTCILGKLDPREGRW